ncbi:MAG: hypothetical protein JXA95_16925 [Spirochaetales bacterium]|nr:hypothetical protein [Spirochaetales bacterium]
MKKAFTVSLLLLSAAMLLASDFGLTLDGSTSLPYTPGTQPDWDTQSYKIRTSLWANHAPSRDVSYEFQSSYTYSDSRPFFLELDKVQYTGKFNLPGEESAVLNLKAGRIPFADFSGKVFAHKGDGINLNLSYSGISFSAFAAYTGLLQVPSNSILLTESDTDDSLVDEDLLFTPLANPRIILGLTETVAGIGGGHNLAVSLLYQQDLRKPEDTLRNTMDTFYTGIGMSGPFLGAANVLYNAFGYGNTGWYGYNRIFAYMTGGSLNLLMPKLLSSRLSVEALYSSGDKDHFSFYEGNSVSYSTAFVPITASPAGMVFSAQQTNLAYLSGTFSLKPFSATDWTSLKNTLLQVKGVSFVRSTPGPISSGGVRVDTFGLYLGSEVDLNILIRLVSDFGFSLSGGVFIPSDNMEVVDIQTKASAAFSLSI